MNEFSFNRSQTLREKFASKYSVCGGSGVSVQTKIRVSPLPSPVFSSVWEWAGRTWLGRAGLVWWVLTIFSPTNKIKSSGISSGIVSDIETD